MSGVLKSKDSYHHGGLRDELLKVALQLIAEEGVEQVTFARLATACGVTRSAFYRHFENKHQLLLTLAIKGYDQLANKLLIARKKYAGNGRELLKAVGKAYIHFAAKHPALYKLMFATEAIRRSQDATLRAAGQQSFDVLLEIVGELSPSNTTPEYCRVSALAAWSMVHGYATLMLSQRVDRVLKDTDKNIVEQLLDHFYL